MVAQITRIFDTKAAAAAVPEGEYHRDSQAPPFNAVNWCERWSGTAETWRRGVPQLRDIARR